MEIENSFEVPVPVDQAWELFNDVERIAPCLPGAEITENLGDGRFRGQARVKLGPVTLSFVGEAEFVEQDETTHTVRLSASGRDQTGRGTARAMVTTNMLPRDGGTEVKLVTSLHLSGAVAQFGRQGIVTDVSTALIGQFADCLSQRFAGAPAAVDSTGGAAAGTTAPAPVASRAESISVLALVRGVVVGMARRLVERVRQFIKKR